MSAAVKKAKRKGKMVAVAEKRVTGIMDEMAKTRTRTKLEIPGYRPDVTRSLVAYANRGAQTHSVLTGLHRYPGARIERKVKKQTE